MESTFYLIPSQFSPISFYAHYSGDLSRSSAVFAPIITAFANVYVNQLNNHNIMKLTEAFIAELAKLAETERAILSVYFYW